MDDLISRQAAINALMEILDRPNHAEFLYTDEICRALNHLPSAQPTQTNMFNALETLDCIDRQAAIDALGEESEVWTGKDEYAQGLNNQWHYDVNALKKVPSAQPEIIRCNVCRHWHQTTGEMKGFGLGDCDYLEKKLVICNGYCYWAERKEDE